MRKREALLFALCAGTITALLGACDSGEKQPVCESVLEASRGDRPFYRFDGGAVTSLSVVRIDEPEVIVWGLATPDVDALASPVEHGQRPDGTVQTAREETFLRGAVWYRVRIERLSGEVCTTDFLVD